MAGMRIVVCLPGSAAGRVDAAVADAMAPFEREKGLGGEFDIWDHYRMCGGAEGSGFAVLAGSESDPRLLHDRPRYDGTSEPSLPGMCAGGPRGLLDFSATCAESVVLAGRAWDLWAELSGRHPAPESLESFVERSKAEMGVPPFLQFRMDGCPDPWTPAYERYRAQPLVRTYLSALDELKSAARSHRYGTHFLDCADPLRTVGGHSREDFIRYHSRIDGMGFENVLTLEGWWYEYGEEGLHSACGGRAACPHTPDITPGPLSAGQRYLEGVPDDALLVYLRLHV
ncbi:hypothetical protein OG429_02935 [Streptomyces sp. NBC_00190]|uniref:hypothetical protein n=1 Tax=unclassified Streptomyces TaxID=2593676 RepID=UPI002E288E72|nr:hypothetical protein [Streptomyces sp. NBC_00190]WSZ38366.1 hypothetical protein OG239_05945 [Streptomyces sp. NBC_00868]